MSICNLCKDWTRTEIKIGKITNHHPNCPRYNDSLIDVWRVSDGTNGFVTLSESQAQECLREAQDEDINDLKITKEKMHREIFEKLPEFDGF